MGRPRQMCLGGISGGEPYADGAARRPPIHEFGFRPQVDGRRPSGLLVRDLAPAVGDPRTVLRDRAWLEPPSGRHGEPPSSEHSPTRSVSSVCAFGPDGWGPERRRRTPLAQAVDPDGVGRARLGCSVRSPSGIRRRCRRAVGPRVGTCGTVGCSALPASPEAGLHRGEGRCLRLLDARSGLAAMIDWERPRRFFVPEPLPAPEASVSAPLRGAWRAGSLGTPRA